MARAYASKPSKLTAAALPCEVLLSIGRLVRACAEMEDIVTLYICRLSDVSEGRALILLGRSTFRQRLEIAKYFATAKGKATLALHKRCFPPDLQEILSCRNTVAHGTLLGQNEEGDFAFLTTNPLAPVDSYVRHVVESYSAESISAYATLVEEAIPGLEAHLSVGALRQKRLRQHLLPHRKAQPAPRPKRKRPPRSSRAK